MSDADSETVASADGSLGSLSPPPIDAASQFEDDATDARVKASQHTRAAEEMEGLLALVTTPGAVELVRLATTAGLDLTKLRSEVKSARLVTEAGQEQASRD